MKEAIFQSGQTETPPSIPQVKEGSFEDLFEMTLFDKNLKEFTAATIGEPVVVQGPVHHINEDLIRGVLGSRT